MSELWSLFFLWSWPDRVARHCNLPGCVELPTGLPAGLHSQILTIDRKLEVKRLKCGSVRVQDEFPISNVSVHFPS